MIAGKFRTFLSTVFPKSLRYVAGAPHIDYAVRASEDVNKGSSAHENWWFSRWEMRKIIFSVLAHA
jgi:hypothetical protein